MHVEEVRPVPRLRAAWQAVGAALGRPARNVTVVVWPKTYHGFIDMLGGTHCTVEDGETGTTSPLEHHREWASDGVFAWGYAGAGPSDLALAILADHLGARPPLDLVMHFKHEVIAGIPNGSDWRLASREVAVFLGRHLSSNERTTQ